MVGAALALAACNAPAESAEARQWTMVSWGGTAGDRQLYFIDRAATRRSGSVVEIDTVTIREKPTPGGTDRVEEHNRIFCETRSALSLDQRLFGGGKLLLRGEPEKAPTRFPAGSAWQILIDGVCEDDLPGPATGDPAATAKAYLGR